MSVLLFQLDGKIPNLALMRIAAHHKALGEEVLLRRASTTVSLSPRLWDRAPTRVYASAIFTRSRPLVEQLLAIYPGAIVGGTGWDVSLRLEDLGLATHSPDYSIYPRYQQSIGFTQRGCRLKCPFCVVPRKEGGVAGESTIAEIWRGHPLPKELLLLDNDFFGQQRWRERIEELREGRFKVSFNQGINCRMITQESAAAIASVDYRDDGMKTKRVYTAWDNKGDEKRLLRGLTLLVDAGVRPREIMVYMLIGFWPGESEVDWDYRRARIREFGALPYPMPYRRTSQAIGFQRFVLGAYDKRVSWEEFAAADCQPRRLGLYRQRGDIFR